MIRLSFLAAALLSAAAQPAAAQEAARGLTLEHRMLLRCSAAFALVAHGQESGDAAMLSYPAVAVPGREYFVQAMARVMDETGMGREAVTEELTQEAQRLTTGDGIARIMPACLASLADIAPPPG